MLDFKNKEYLQSEYLEKRRTLDDIAREFNTSGKHVAYYVSKYRLQKGSHSNLRVNKDNLFKWSNPVFNYMAGLILTDGYLDVKNNRLCLRVCNEGSFKVLNELRDYFKIDSPVHIIKRAQYKDCNDLTFKSVKLYKVLAKAGIEGLKNIRSFDCEFIQSLSVNCQAMFFRGILDGDGSIRKSGTYRIAMLSEEIIENHLKFINDLLHTNYQVKYQRNSSYKHKYPSIELHKEDSLKWFNLVYSNFPKFRFSDKYFRYQSISW